MGLKGASGPFFIWWKTTADAKLNTREPRSGIGGMAGVPV